MTGKKFFKCTVCGDVHFGQAGPEKCPTCQQIDKYVEMAKEEALKFFN